MVRVRVGFGVRVRVRVRVRGCTGYLAVLDSLTLKQLAIGGHLLVVPLLVMGWG